MRPTRLFLPAVMAVAACSNPNGQSQAQTPPMAQPTRAAPTSAMSMKQSFAPVVRRAAPAVVNISSKRMVRQQADPFWQLFGMGAPQDRVEGSLGSGVIVRSDGVIITNNHVVADGQEITVALADRREFPAKVLLVDPRTDLAVLKIEVGAERLPVLPIDDTNFRIYVAGRVRNKGDIGRMRSKMGGKFWWELTEEEHQRYPGDYEAQVGQGPITIHSEEHFAQTDRGILMLRRMLQAQLDAVAQGSDPIGVNFDPGAPPIMFEAGNYIREE